MNNKIKNLFFLSFGHFSNDLYPGMLSPLLPVFIDKFGWNMAQAGFLVTALNIVANITQPAFGIINDKKPSRAFLWIGLLIVGLPFLFIMNISSYTLMIAAMIVCGIGVGCYHPVAVVAAGLLADEKHRGLSMAFFTAGGQISFMVAPLIAVLIIEHAGESWMPFIALPGILTAMYFFRNRSIAVNKGHGLSLGEWFLSIRSNGRELLILWIVSSFSSITQMLVNSFLPMLAMARGWSYSSSAYILSASLFASMLGTIIGGHLSDIHGRKKIVALTMLAAAPLYYTFLFTSGLFSIAFLIMGTAVLASTIPVIIILAQRTNPKLAGMASSLVMGLSYTMGAIAATPFGALADKIGIEKSMFFPMILPVIGGLVIFLLKNNND